MPKSRQQKKRERHAAKRKAKRRSRRARLVPTGRKAILRRASHWPVLGCWVNKDWRDTTELNQVAIARRNPHTGEVFAGVVLMDRACLGAKNAFASNFATAAEFRKELLGHIRQAQELTEIELNLAAAIIKAGIDYAAQFGFRPHADYREAAILLGDADPDAVTEEIPVGGPEGKPLYVSGPYDNPEKIMAHLRRKVGPDGFNSVYAIDGPPEGFEGLEIEEDDEPV
ncbi:MAG: hypothetical protein U9R05_04265 [Chloroflexota bacterium]|nr:hypothetical protein [Chloroflexota bacterium]